MPTIVWWSPVNYYYYQYCGENCTLPFPLLNIMLWQASKLGSVPTMLSSFCPETVIHPDIFFYNVLMSHKFQEYVPMTQTHRYIITTFWALDNIHSEYVYYIGLTKNRLSTSDYFLMVWFMVMISQQKF